MCVLIFSLVVGTTITIQSAMVIERESREKIQAITETKQRQLNNLIMETENLVSSLNSTILSITDLKYNTADPKKYEKYIDNIVKDVYKRNHHFIGISLLFTPDSIENVQEINYENISKDGVYTKIKIHDKNDDIKNKILSFQAKKEGVWSNAYTKNLHGNIKKEIISYTKPIFKENVFLGVIEVDIDFNLFKDIINHIKISNTGYAFLLNENLNYMVHKTLKQSDNLASIDHERYKYIGKEIKKTNTGVKECFFDGENKLLGYAHLSNGWIIVTSVKLKEVLKDIKYIVFFITLIILIGMLISSRIAIYVSRKISEPVVLAAEFAEEIANGNLDIRLNIQSNDETEILSKALNKATDNTRNLIQALRAKEEKLVQQVEKLKKSEETIRVLAYHDSITNLPNRNYLIRKLPAILSILDTDKKRGALIYLDLDNFQIINDTLGHTAGDTFLKQMSMDLKRFLKEEDTLFHLGEDAFVFFIPFIQSDSEIFSFIENILDLFHQPIYMEKSKEFHITTSIGVALYPDHGQDLENLLRNADTALNVAKNSGKNKFEVFTKEMNSNMAHKIDLENNLRHAVENNEFVVFYQPKINAKTGKIISMEALVRWISPTFGFVSPSEFIPLAEETNLIVPIGEYVLKEACRQNKIWQQKGFPPLFVAVNLSTKQLRQKNLTDMLVHALIETELDPKWLELEITESALMDDFDSSIQILKKIKNMGISIYLDDFGTGYSSLNYLRTLPISAIKIDKSFIDGLTSNSKDAFIASSLINLAHGINLSVVAEGIETIEQFDLLKNYGCDEIQGYYFSKPLNPADFEELLKSQY